MKKDDDLSIHVTFDNEICGIPRQFSYLVKKDIWHETNFVEIGSPRIIFYIKILYDKLLEYEHMHIITFIVPSLISTVRDGNEENHARAITNR
ncbi:hypothetical protein PanWU01x14_128720 [Parasponia andersonii]|uniref:Uncharacterized protein n=1 Tax=Parasponia andersonii TaxID=3476 RepID=A0A2P5CS65_PARAD|nr:hypothetical protein PanWU01x14_128720 [Parasponia andersonii]